MDSAFRAAFSTCLNVFVEMIGQGFPLAENQDTNNAPFNDAANNGSGADDDHAENVQLEQVVVEQPHNRFVHQLARLDQVNIANAPVVDGNNNTAFPNIGARQAP